jgi:hypothetical protein
MAITFQLICIITLLENLDDSISVGIGIVRKDQVLFLNGASGERTGKDSVKGAQKSECQRNTPEGHYREGEKGRKGK